MHLPVWHRMSMRHLWLVATVLAGLAGAGQQKPAAEEQSSVIQVDVDVVNLFCSVRDRKGAFLGTLAKEDFTVTEDGKPQQVRYFTRETDLPLTIGLLVDVSKSQERLIEVERRAAGQFFSQVLRPKDMAFLISFGVEAELLQDYTNSPRLLQKALEDLRLNAAVGGLHPGPVPNRGLQRGTILYDAVYLAAQEKLRREVGRKVLVLITDGVDVGSRIKLEEAVEAAQKSDVIIYSIYYVDVRGYGYFGVSDSALKKMSEETGGRLFHVDRRNDLERVFAEIQQEMRSQYAIGYSSLNPAKDGSFRRVEIRTNRKDVKVQARRGYYAVKPER